MLAIAIFTVFVGFLFWLSWFLGKKAQSADGFFVAGGEIHWFVNGIALTGGYLSAASFLGICGMIAFKGFDGYLYSIGFLSGWVVALFVVAEPLRRLGKYTFADALGSRFKSKTIHLAAGISTLVICMCYLVPQMVGAGVLIEPLLGIPHHWGVIVVGVVVIVIVASAGMSSTTYVQFIKAGMLILFSGLLVTAVCVRGLHSEPDTINTSGEKVAHYQFKKLTIDDEAGLQESLNGTGYSYVDTVEVDSLDGESMQKWVVLSELSPLEVDEDGETYHLIRRGQRLPVVRDPEGAIAAFMSDVAGTDIGGEGREVTVQSVRVVKKDGGPYAKIEGWWRMEERPGGGTVLVETQDVTKTSAGDIYVNGLPAVNGSALAPMGRIAEFGSRTGHDGKTGPVGPLRLLSIFSDPETEIELPRGTDISYKGSEVELYYPEMVAGNELMRPGGHFKIATSSIWGKLDFISLMLALFFGTAALPHVLIRYYTVKDSTAARRSTIVAISAIGLFYIMTLYLGLGAIANGVLNPQSDNMSAPLLALSFGKVLFAIITALAFATVLGTVSGLIIAASGAVANDLMDKFMHRSMSGKAKVVTAKITAVSVGVVAVILGILFKGVNVGFLVGWAFAVAASANFPAIIMVLFWKRTTAAGIICSILVGIAASLGIILAGPDMFKLYGFSSSDAWIPLGQPAILSMPLSFVTLIVVSLMTQESKSEEDLAELSKAG
ncbi:Acetate transporter ActP [Anaerohalosphaera lusitana]|uniref:Acetate transporter ActP n=1 Tax=Anaerohalosphaera lusitana TaxID=1936003 RepID=A0A1U9NI41_9BACT|nr:cation acetate symporter [Anaerohalosphaera lusitana]AQT67485.1 Acetate transporter ActP [Anaerohalosphaera lusitana]